ncbi:excitatory amino acid transporter 3-like isoform X1 [Brachyhypopomus gauderio]|uniref:excitatory amino acid transporter 3-like isoform X1 n=1 Tax=Brachyhypopomus gauderio TaxID=698409 RepID=UPI0040415CBB
MAVRLSGFMKKHWLFLSTMLSVSLGVGLGVLMRGWSSLSTINRLYFGYPGNLLMQLLKMITLPLICSSMITGVAAMDSGSSGKIGLRTIAYTLSTTITAIILGMILATVIKPGTSSHSTEDQWTEAPQSAATVDTMLDLIRNLIPENLVQACFQQYKSTRVPVRPSATNASQIEYKLVGSYKNGMNILGILTFCILLGLALGRMGKRGKRFVEFFSAVNEAIMRIVKIILCYMPVGIIFLIATKVIGIEDWNIFRTLGFFMLTVLIGLAIHSMLVLPLLYMLVVRRNPYTFICGMTHALLTAFTVASSSATLPLTLKCAEENNGIDLRISRFVLPIGATINKNGSALFKSVTVFFIAQMNNYPLDAGKLTIAGIMTLATCIGGAALPSAGMVTIIILLAAVGLPVNDVGLLIIVDWLLDRFRTTVNVLGDAIGAAIVEKLSQKELQTR